MTRPLSNIAPSATTGAGTQAAPIAGWFGPVAVEQPGGGRIRERRPPAPSNLVTVTGVGGRPIQLHRLAAIAWRALVQAARADGIRAPLLLPMSGYRSVARQERRWQWALCKYGSAREARRWVAPPGRSAHMTGRAIDLHLGDRNASERVGLLRRLPAYRWLVLNAGRYGFYPYPREPWHWEYNPPQASAFEFGEVDTVSAELATAAHAVPAAPTISSLADFSRGLHAARRRTRPVAGVCVHTTGGGIRVLATRLRRPAALVAVDRYLRGAEFPHYLVGYDGNIFAICDEQSIAPHAGWAGIGGRSRWATWTAPGWWSSVWHLHGARTPADLLPRGARSPNEVYIGVELLADPPGLPRGGFTDAQYVALARLVRDIIDRWHVAVPRVPSRQLLGHEDVNPIGRQDGAGGWDPGAHRVRPRFSWPKLWTAMTAAAVVSTARRLAPFPP